MSISVSHLSTIGTLRTTLLFGDYTAADGCKFWRSDGTVTSTVLLYDFAPGWANSNTRPLVVTSQHVYAVSAQPSALWAARLADPKPIPPVSYKLHLPMIRR